MLLPLCSCSSGTCLHGQAWPSRPAARRSTRGPCPASARADPQTEPGTITVRALLGSFSQPAVGVDRRARAEVGRTAARPRRAPPWPGSDGRANFTDLAGVPRRHRGSPAPTSTASARARSRSRVSPTQGYRVLLVEGEGSSGAASQPGRGPARQPGRRPVRASRVLAEVPLPGVAFVNPGTPRGALLVGTLDLRAGTPLERVKVRLVLTGPDGKVESARGRSATPAAPRALPRARASCAADGLRWWPRPTCRPASRAQPAVPASRARTPAAAVVLAVIGPQRAGPQRRQTMGPRAVPDDLARQRARHGRRARRPADQRRPGHDRQAGLPPASASASRTRTGEDGVARVADIPLTGEGLFHAEASYAGAPWTLELLHPRRAHGRRRRDAACYLITTDLDAAALGGAVRRRVDGERPRAGRPPVPGLRRR